MSHPALSIKTNNKILRFIFFYGDYSYSAAKGCNVILLKIKNYKYYEKESWKHRPDTPNHICTRNGVAL